MLVTVEKCECFSSGSHPASYPIGTVGSYSGGKQLKREADHSTPFFADVKNVWSYTFTRPISPLGVVLNETQDVFMVWYLVNHRVNLPYRPS
jgi:hypothetical protein